MKTAYIAIIFLVVFQMTILLVNSTGIFPSDKGFYSDIDQKQLEAAGNDPLELFKVLFTPAADTTVAGFSLGAGIWAVVFLIAGLGTGAAIFTHSFVPAVLAVQGILFIPLATRSMTFFNSLFRTWDHASLTYLSLILVVGFLVIIFLTIIETPTHGRS